MIELKNIILFNNTIDDYDDESFFRGHNNQTGALFFGGASAPAAHVISVHVFSVQLLNITSFKYLKKVSPFKFV